MTTARPFLKWAGGKHQLLPQLLNIFPRQCGTYYEPFVGGGSVFFEVASRKRINFGRAVLNDANQELIDCYQAVRSFPRDLILQLKRWEVNKETFHRVRSMQPEDLSPARRAARMIYLNKVCFNGLYRVNKQGQFNSPFGRWPRPPRPLDAPNLLSCSAVLNRYAALYNQDFAQAVLDAQEDDLVYFDPPYVPLNPTSNFTSYTKDGFYQQDQERLALLFRQLVARGVKVILSNSDTPLVRELYHGFEMHEVLVRRSINSKGTQRGGVPELIVVGRPELLVDPYPEWLGGRPPSHEQVDYAAYMASLEEAGELRDGDEFTLSDLDALF